MAKVHYLGGGFIPKIPARNLDADEVKRYGLKRLLASGLYEEVKPPKSKVKVTYEDDLDLLSGELERLDEVFNNEIEEG
jgi:hypothetical protein